MNIISSIPAAFIASLLLAGCGADAGPVEGSTDTVDLASSHCDDTFKITSSAFSSGAAIPDTNTCNGRAFGTGTSPKLSWENAPKHTKSFALVFKDISLTTHVPPDNRGYHWAIWDIPKNVDSLPAALGSEEFLSTPKGARQWSRFSPYGYLGPCPNFDPSTTPIHTDQYSFTLYALDVKILDYPPPDPAIANYTKVLDDYLIAHAIGMTELLGTSAATPLAPPAPPAPPVPPSPRP